MNTNITKTWTITIDGDEVFARCTNESLYQTYNRMEESIKGDALVIQEDDRGQFNVYFSAAIANLGVLLARRMDGPASVVDGTVTFVLNMHDNHEDAILPILRTYCYEYVVRQIMEQWYRVEFGSELEKLEINHCLHYRKFPVRRRIGPLF